MSSFQPTQVKGVGKCKGENNGGRSKANQVARSPLTTITHPICSNLSPRVFPVFHRVPASARAKLFSENNVIQSIKQEKNYLLMFCLNQPFERITIEGSLVPCECKCKHVIVSCSNGFMGVQGGVACALWMDGHKWVEFDVIWPKWNTSWKLQHAAFCCVAPIYMFGAQTRQYYCWRVNSED